MREDRPKSRPILLNRTAKSADPSLPAFLARPAGAPVYHGFPLLEESRTSDGWVFGTITGCDEPETDSGDAFVEAPDGSRAGIVWQVGFGEVQEILPPDECRWGVYSVSFPAPVRSARELVAHLATILPTLRDIHSRVKGTEAAKT